MIQNNPLNNLLQNYMRELKQAERKNSGNYPLVVIGNKTRATNVVHFDTEQNLRRLFGISKGSQDNNNFTKEQKSISSEYNLLFCDPYSSQ